MTIRWTELKIIKISEEESKKNYTKREGKIQNASHRANGLPANTLHWILYTS